MRGGDAMEKSIREIVGERVVRLRRRAHLTQPELAAKADFSLTTLNRVERAHQSLYIEGLVALAQALGTTPDYLLGFAEEPERDSPRPQTRRRQPGATVGAV